MVRTMELTVGVAAGGVGEATAAGVAFAGTTVAVAGTAVGSGAGTGSSFDEHAAATVMSAISNVKYLLN